MQQEKTQSRRLDRPGGSFNRMDFGPSFLERGRVYAIGDIHGRSDLLDRIIAAIRSDLEAIRSRIA
jgi:hypothetical protein